jgi:hypothetical protein
LLESSVEAGVVRNAELRGGVAWKLNPLWVVGVPDRIVLLPGARVVFFETKTVGGRVSRIQKYIHGKLRNLGFRVETPWTPEEVLAVFTSLDREAACAKS